MTPTQLTQIPDGVPPYTSVKHCRVCRSREMIPLFFLGEQFVSDFVPNEKIHRGIICPIDIELCPLCGLVQNKYTARQDFLYSRHYWYRSGVTASMREALAEIAREIESRVEIGPTDVVLDIGSNDGTLLRSHSKGIKVGVEPAQNLWEEGSERIDVLVKDFWSADAFETALHHHHLLRGEMRPENLTLKAKVVTALGMFYDLEDPNPFIADVKRVLAPDGLFVAQLMCLKQTLEKFDVGNFAHEHLEFYSLKSLHHLFGKHGLEIFDVEENDVNGGSYRLWVRHGWSNSPGMSGEMQHRKTQAGLVEGRMKLDDRQTYQDWFRKVHDNAKKVRAFINHRVQGGEIFDVYGASTKGNVILQHHCLGNDLIRWAADRSPEKHGLYTVGTWIPIVSEEQSRERRPDWWVVLPYAFLSEFVKREMETLKKGTKFLVPLPVPKVVYIKDGEIKEEAL